MSIAVSARQTSIPPVLASALILRSPLNRAFFFPNGSLKVNEAGHVLVWATALVFLIARAGRCSDCLARPPFVV